MTEFDSTQVKTQFLEVGEVRYAYRRMGQGPGLPLLCLQHFTGTLDNWDPALVDALAERREVILFDNAGIGRSSGTPASTTEAMAAHALAFLDGLGIGRCDILGFSLGGMVAQLIALTRPALVRRLVLAGTAPRGGEMIMRLDKPVLAKPLADPTLKGYAVLQKIFFAPSDSSQAAGAAYVDRLGQRTEDREPPSGPQIAQAQMAAFQAWGQVEGERFAELKAIAHPVLVFNGVHDEMIPIQNSYWLAEHLPNAVLLVFPDAGHGALFQFHRAFSRQVTAFLETDGPWAPD